MSARRAPWLLVIDPQTVFADPGSPWGSPAFPDALPHITRLARAAGAQRTLVTRWLPTADRSTAWGDYFAAWPFADVPAEDPLYDLVAGVDGLTAHPTIDAPSFGKWGPLAAVTGPAPELLVTGVATDCCVISTVLAAADAGARVRVVPEACAASTPENGSAALAVMELYAPQVELVAVDTALATLGER